MSLNIRTKIHQRKEIMWLVVDMEKLKDSISTLRKMKG